MIKRIKQRRSGSNVVQHLKHNGTILISLDEISEKLARTFASNSSLANCLPGFLAVKTRQERKLLDFSSDGEEHYNLPFSMAELMCSLESSHDTAVGPYGIHYHFVKQLPESALRLLLQLNNIWKSGVIPASW